MEHLLLLDRYLLNAINAKMAHMTLDLIMRFWSAEWPWYLILIYFVFDGLRKKRWQQLNQVAWIGLTIGLSDMVASYIFKPWVARLRPCRVEHLVRIVDSCSGMYGFPSNHAANAAVFATMWFLLQGHRQGAVAWSCAIMVGLSRVYLGVHYPSDILAGFVFGSLLGSLSIWLGRRFAAFCRLRSRSSSL